MNSSSRSILRFLSIMVMVHTFLPLFSVNLPSGFNSQHIWTFLWTVSVVLLYSRVILSRYYLFIMAYGVLFVFVLLNTVWIEVDAWMVNQVIGEFYEVSIALSIMAYYFISKDMVGLRKLTIISFVSILITALMSIYTSYIDPMYLRNLVGISGVNNQSQVDAILSLQKYGGGNYGFFSAIVCLIPILIYYYKFNEKSYFDKKTVLVIGIIFFYSLIRVQIFANILVAFFFLIIGIFVKKELSIASLVIVVLMIIILILPAQIFADFFLLLSDYFDKGSHMHAKLVDFSLFIDLGGALESTGTGGRAARFPLLLESFLSNPIIGGPDWNGHMYWMNKLAVFGLLGTLPFVWVIIQFVKNMLKNFQDEYKVYFVLSILSVVVLGFLKALSGRELWYTFFVVLPGLYYLKEQRSQKK